MSNQIKEFLDAASEAYYEGKPFISDAQFDYLADLISYNRVGAAPKGLTRPHKYPMYSLQKYYAGEGKVPLQSYTGQKITTPKLDGAALSLNYARGQLVEALTRGDGEIGQVVTDKFMVTAIVPRNLPQTDTIQVTGELVAPKHIANARNYSSGALGLNDVSEFASRELFFVAYDVHGIQFDYYSQKLEYLHSLGFKTVADTEFCDSFPHDGAVVRINKQSDYDAEGHTSKFPRGAYAIKNRSSGVPTILREVVWQTGKSGKCTPVAVFDPIVLDGATVTRATLNNPKYIRALNLDIGDTLFVERSGGIIPCILRSEKQIQT